MDVRISKNTEWKLFETNGKNHWEELVAIIRQIPEPKTGAVVGVCNGGSCRALLEAYPHLYLYAIDPWQKYEDYSDPLADGFTQEEFDRRYNNTVECLSDYLDRCSIVRDFSVSESTEHIFGLDFVFIDANHAYEWVKRDLDYWQARVKSGGLVCGHDFGLDSVQRALREIGLQECHYSPHACWHFKHE